jgi:hypothetical protein
LKRPDLSTSLLRVSAEWKLSFVAVLEFEQVHCLAVAGRAKSAIELDSGECELLEAVGEQGAAGVGGGVAAGDELS